MEKEKMFIKFKEYLKEVFSDRKDIFLDEKFKKKIENALFSPRCFLTVGNLLTEDIETKYTKNIENVLGYESKEFTTNEFHKIVLPEHLVLAMHYALITFKILRKHSNYNLDEKYGYGIEFSAKKNNKLIRLERFCWLFSFDENGNPCKHLDIWTKISETDYTTTKLTESVKYRFHIPRDHFRKEIEDKFYREWIKTLGFHFTRSQLKVLKYLETTPSTRKEISELIYSDKGEKTIKHHIEEAKKRANNFIEDSTYKMRGNCHLKNNLLQMIIEEPKISSEKQLIHFAKKYNLFPNNYIF